MEPLSSFAINIAAGIVLNKLFHSNLEVEKGIINAFNKATKDWSRNEIIRDRNIIILKKERDQYLESLYKKKSIPITEELSLFIEHFNKRLCENTSAYNYLKEIKDEKRHLKAIEYLKGLKKGQYEIIENIQDSKIKIGEVLNIVKKIEETQNILSSSSQSTLFSLMQTKKTVESLIKSYRKSLSNKELDIMKLKEDIGQFELDIKMINENINLLKRNK